MSLANTKPDTLLPGQLPEIRLSFRTAYAKFSLILLAITTLTVLPHYHTLLTNFGSVSIALLLHGTLFLGWYILFAFQSSLIASRRLPLHRKLGYWSIPLTLVLAVSGTYMMIGTMSSYQSSWDSQTLAARASFVWAIFHTLVSFVSFYCLAIAYRNRSQAHKRFMLLAALSMVAASVTRVAYLPFIPVDGTALVLLSTYALLITPMVIDRVQLKRIHPTLKWGVPVYVFTQLLCIGWIPTTALGRALAFPF